MGNRNSFKPAKKKKELKGKRYSLASGERGSRNWKAVKQICFLLHALWGDLLLSVDVSFFSPPYFGFLCLSTGGGRWPPKSRNLFEFQTLGREDLIGPFGVKWLPLTSSAKARKSRYWSTNKSSGFYLCDWENKGDSFHRIGFVDSPQSVWCRTFWSLTAFPLRNVIVVHLRF